LLLPHDLELVTITDGLADFINVVDLRKRIHVLLPIASL
jgi:hypothetical protein